MFLACLWLVLVGGVPRYTRARKRWGVDHRCRFEHKREVNGGNNVDNEKRVVYDVSEVKKNEH